MAEDIREEKSYSEDAENMKNPPGISTDPKISQNNPMPESASVSLQDLAVLLELPVQTVFEWVLEGRLFVHAQGEEISLRLSDPVTKGPASS